MQFHGCVSQHEAERSAAVLTNRYCNRKGLNCLKGTQFYLVCLHDIV